MQKTEETTIIINEKSYDKKKVGKFELAFFDPEAVYDDYRLANYKFLTIDQFHDYTGRDVVLLQDFRLNKGGTFWDGSYLTTKYLIEHCLGEEASLGTQKFLEIGSGTSLPSIVLGLRGYKVITTDLDYLLPFVTSNIDENLSGSKRDNVVVKKLEWGNQVDMESISMVESDFDVIIASEVIYIEEVFDELIATFKYFSKEKTSIVLTYRIRMKEKLELFFSKFDKFFDYSYVDRSIIDLIHPNKDLHILKAKLKKEYLV